MQKFYGGMVSHRKIILLIFIAVAACCAFLQNLVAVNYDMTDYLPESSPSSVSMDVMQEEFDGGIPNARVMIRDVTVPGALDYKEQLKAVDGVKEVMWLDDAVSILLPLAVLDTDTVEAYYKDKNALFTVTIEEDKTIAAVEAIRDVIGEENAMAGSAVSTAVATANTIVEIQKITVIGVLFVLIVLILTTKSWLEPIMILAGLGIAIMINNGSNLIFGEISFVSNAAGSILQLAVSLDYSVFLIHRFEECRKENTDVKGAMVEALCKTTTSILSSGLTTIIGFLALLLMQFLIGPDLGLVLAKGVAISLVTVFVFMPALILSVYKCMDKTKHRPFTPSFRKFGRVVRRVSIPMAVIFAVVVVPAYLASGSNAYYYGASDMFGEDSQIGMDTAAIEEVFGENDTYVLLVPRGDTATETALSKELQCLPHITGIISYVDMAGAEIPLEYLDEDTLSQLVSENYSRMVLSVELPYEGGDTFQLVEQVRNVADEYYPGKSYLAGEGISTYDLMDTVTADMVKVNVVAVAAVFIVLLLSMKSISLPVILVLSIETAIWLNFAIPYFMDRTVFYIAYLITSSIQLGSTVDYAILMTDRYRENREWLDRKEAVVETISDVTVSILTSGSAMTAVGMLMGYVSSNQLLAQLGIFIGRGGFLSLIIVLFVLPGILYLFDRWESKRLLALFTAGTLACFLWAPATVSAAEPNTPKEEVIYMNLNADGSVQEIHVVNIFELDKAGRIVDYGRYQSLRNMTATDPLDYSGDMVTVDTGAGKLYYEGRLDSNVMPWDIEIHYYMDGKEYSGKEITGMSGALKITMDITENTSCKGSFFDDYALQASLALDTETCKNINAQDAAVANVGSDKQIAYTILPGKGAEIQITADVTDFEMNGVAVNGIPLNLNIEVDDGELMGQVKELMDGIEQLDGGAGELADGVAELRDGVQNDLKGGVSDLRDGAGQLYSGASDLKDGGSSLQTGAADLKNGAVSLDKGLRSLGDGITQIQKALHELNAQSGTLAGGSAEFKKALVQLQTALGGVSASTENLSALTEASAAIRTGIDSMVSGASALQKNISFASYKAAMAEKGLDIDGLKRNNEEAVNHLSALIPELKNQAQAMQGAGADASALENLAGQLENVIALLGADHASILGTEGYLNACSQNLSALAAGATALQTNYGAFDGKISELADSLGGMAYQMSELSQAVNTLVSEYGKIDKGITAYTGAVAQIVAGYSQVSGGAAQLVEGSGALAEGSSSLYSGADKLLSGIVQIYDGTGTLYDGTGELDEGVAELLDGITQLHDGSGKLKDGTAEMRSETEGMDTQISDKMDELLESITGGNIEVTSFVSEKNTDVESVQFVIQTDRLLVEEEEQVVEEETENLNLWHKFLRLFQK